MVPKVGHLKPFLIEEKKEGPKQTISETTANKWQGNIVANIKKNEKWLPYIGKTWGQKKAANRGYTGTQAEASVLEVDQLLEYVSQYAPNCLYQDIMLRAKSLFDVWLLVRNWARLKLSECKQQTYFTVKNCYVTDGDVTPTDFFFSLKKLKRRLPFVVRSFWWKSCLQREDSRRG